VAENGVEAVAKWAEGEIDLILMDVQMPDLDGLAATAQIRQRKHSSGRHVPIVAMTAHAMAGDHERCLQAGMDGYLSKPVQRQKLLAELDRFAVNLTPDPAKLTAEPGLNRTGAEKIKIEGEMMDKAELLSRLDGTSNFCASSSKFFSRTPARFCATSPRP
jgi:two-component system sensor histidine kinase/response regulator